jgi:hypothetical protein
MDMEETWKEYNSWLKEVGLQVEPNDERLYKNALEMLKYALPQFIINILCLKSHMFVAERGLNLKLKFLRPNPTRLRYKTLNEINQLDS